MSDSIQPPVNKRPSHLPNIVWPKILSSAVFGILDEDEKRNQNTLLWNIAYVFMVNWYSKRQVAEKKLNPFLLKHALKHSNFDLWDALSDYDQLNVYIPMSQINKIHERIFALQGAIFMERAVAQVALISHSFECMKDLFKARNINLTPEHESIMWAGLSNTGRYHHFPMDDDQGLDYREPSLPEDLLPELHDSAREYHRNIHGAFAAVLFANRLRPHPESQPLLEREELSKDLHLITSLIILNLLKSELLAQQQMAQLRAVSMAANQRDTSWVNTFDQTSKTRPNFFSCPLVGVKPLLSPRFEVFNGDPDYSERSLQERHWRIVMKSGNRFPIFQNEQARVARNISLKSFSPNPTPHK